MMKKRILSVLLCLALLCTVASCLSGCNPSGANGDKTDDGKYTKIKIYTTVSELPENEVAQNEYAKEHGNIVVEYVNVSWDTVDVKYIMDIAANDPPDLVYMNDQKFPSYALRQIVRPLEDVLDDDAPEWELPGMEMYMYGGKHYGITSVEPLLLWYNQTLFDTYGVKSPAEYVAEGNWTWDTFADVAKEMTMDTNDDNEVDIYGYATWRFDSFFLTNGCNVVNYNVAGGIDLLLDSAPVTRSLSFMQDAAYKDKWCNPTGNNTWANDFKAGKLAMTCEGSFIAYEAGMKQTDFDIRVTEMPTGPDNTTGLYPARADAFGLCIGGKNPEAAIEYMRLIREYNEQQDAAGKGYTQQFFSEEEYALIQKLSDRNLIASMYTGIGDLNMKQLDLWSALMSEGVPVATAVAAQKPVWQNEINITLANVGKPTIRPFTPVDVIDFENGVPDSVSNTSPDGRGSNTEWSITEDPAQAISGKSLLVTNNGGTSLLLYTDPVKVFLPGYHTYKVSVDYRMLEDMEDYITLSVRQTGSLFGGKVYGQVMLRDVLAGDTGTLEAEIMIPEDSDDFVVAINGINAVDVVLDNLTITLVQ